MESRWLLLGYGLLFTAVTIGAIYQGKYFITAIAVVQTIFGLGGFWWNSGQSNRTEIFTLLIA